MSLAAQRPGSSVRSGNDCISSIRVGKKGARPAEVRAMASVFEKSATKFKQQKLIKCKQTIQIVTFNSRAFNRIGQLPELTASAVEHKIDIIFHTRTQIHTQGYQISRHWQWIDASHCISLEKLCQCHGRRCRHTYRTKSVKINKYHWENRISDDGSYF